MIDELKPGLEAIINKVFGTLKEGVELSAKLAGSLAPTAAKLMLKEASVIVAKQIAKEIAVISAKQTGKQGGKSVAKKIPLVGAVVGCGLGFWRLSQGDRDGAALELASGLASTAPGYGTAVSVALDIGIAGRDLKHAIEVHNARRDRYFLLTNEWTELLSRLEHLQQAYDVIKRAFDEFDFEDDSDDFLQAINDIPW
jgi:hypothetical protein